MDTAQIAILTSIIGVTGTLLGTILGWALQFIKKRKLIFFSIKITPVGDENFQQAFFNLDVHNTSNCTKAIRNPIIVTYSNKKIVYKDNVQETKKYNNQYDREENEKYRTDIELLEIPANGSINQMCKIEFFDLADVQQNITKVQLLYKDENFKQKKVPLIWNTKNKFNKNSEE